MSKQKFNLGEWRRDTTLTSRDEVEIVISRIETANLDITSAYGDWRDLGFALAQGLGEEGRAFYHRLSRFYSGYRSAETDKQYTACLHSRGHGITLNTLFHRAKLAGVDINTRPLPDCHIAKPPNVKDVAISPAVGADQTPPGDDFPTFPDEIYASMPRLLSDVCSYGISAEDTDMLLLGALTVLSSCLTQVSGIYGQRQVYPNLYLFVGAQASAGKGRLTLCRHLVDVVHADLRRQNVREWEEYHREKSLYEKNKRKEVTNRANRPSGCFLFLPTVVLQPSSRH